MPFLFSSPDPPRTTTRFFVMCFLSHMWGHDIKWLCCRNPQKRQLFTKTPGAKRGGLAIRRANASWGLLSFHSFIRFAFTLGGGGWVLGAWWLPRRGGNDIRRRCHARSHRQQQTTFKEKADIPRPSRAAKRSEMMIALHYSLVYEYLCTTTSALIGNLS